MRFIFSLNLFETNDAIQCTLALDTTVVRKAATVQLLEREVDRGEARFLDGCRGWGRSSGDSTVVVMADDSETTVEGRSGVGITYRWSMMISTAQYLSDHFPL